MNTLAIASSLIRPKTLIASISPVLLSASFALKKGAFALPLFLLLLSTALMLQIVSNIANDYFDGLKGVDGKKRLGPPRMTGSGVLAPHQTRFILGLCAAFTLILGLILSFLGGPLIASIFGLSLICAFIYSAGPFPLSYKGIAEIFAYLFFGPIPVFFASNLFTQSYSVYPLILGALPGTYSLILLTLNNLRDEIGDKKANKHTLIVKRGQSFGIKIIKFALWAQTPFILLLSIAYPKMLFSLILLPETIYFYKKLKQTRDPASFGSFMKPCAKLYLTSTILWASFMML